MTLQETHKRIDEIINDYQETISRARSSRTKRQHKATMQFFKSIKKHLKPLPND